ESWLAFRSSGPSANSMVIPVRRTPSPSSEPPAAISIRELTMRCSTCSMRELCLPIGLGADALRQLDEFVTERTRLKKGEPLYRPGDIFTAMYAIRLGSCKTTVLAEDGREQIAGYR